MFLTGRQLDHLNELLRRRLQGCFAADSCAAAAAHGGGQDADIVSVMARVSICACILTKVSVRDTTAPEGQEGGGGRGGGGGLDVVAGCVLVDVHVRR